MSWPLEQVSRAWLTLPYYRCSRPYVDHHCLGANVYGCIKMGSRPSEAFKVDFKVGSSADNCMDPIGNNAFITVDSAEVICASLGYVQESCTFQKSVWSLAYNGSAYSGSTQSVWSGGTWNNDIYLQNDVPGTFVCPSQYECRSRYLKWNEGTTGPLYVSFEPSLVRVMLGLPCSCADMAGFSSSSILT